MDHWPICRLLSPSAAGRRNPQFLRGQQVQRLRERLAAALGGARKAAAITTIDGRYWQFMLALACTDIDTASSWAAWCRSRSGWCCSPVSNVGAVTVALLLGLVSLIYGVSQIVMGTELRRIGQTLQPVLPYAA